ncbi:MAG: LemA family protein [Candidatus Nitrosocosmicus sp.]|uniref:LemA family protein n=1 Tax=Candidatus Nitrosocosmicus agrestis TaxID=2563600 RepID=UPI00122E33D8|nr:LemA family protein [Candidatus Nitrosocosmicus sp. SS]KAA2281234.1 LemA family protein [Candidatus Nitrosocosmicus sp. SS]KAF0868351.1 LemA family protein [Candidatus Nitrosocosmicus sp. SS]MDR4490511.1 LemA family protein [Candidatus Nitrosocosmicus sp.]
MVNKRVAIPLGIVIVIAIIVIILFVTYFSGFNSAQAKNENVKKLAADTDTQLQRRYDLIPNLVQSVKGYMQFENQTLAEITSLRTQWMATPSTDISQKNQLSNLIEGVLGKIVLTYEAYPSLKSDNVVTRLMDELAGTENRITVARTYYNDGVRDYNTFLKVFPNVIFNNDGLIGLKPWGFAELPQFQADQLVRISVPQVNLTL